MKRNSPCFTLCFYIRASMIISLYFSFSLLFVFYPTSYSRTHVLFLLSCSISRMSVVRIGVLFSFWASVYLALIVAARVYYDEGVFAHLCMAFIMLAVIIFLFAHTTCFLIYVHTYTHSHTHTLLHTYSHILSHTHTHSLCSTRYSAV